MKGQYHMIRRFNLLKDFRKYMLSDKTMYRLLLDYGVNWDDYIYKGFQKGLTREGKHLLGIVNNAEMIEIQEDIRKCNILLAAYRNVSLEFFLKESVDKIEKRIVDLDLRLGELKNNAFPVVDPKHIQMILDRRERKARKHDKKTS